jgi:thiamine-phosphate pyrophosphorylase
MKFNFSSNQIGFYFITDSDISKNGIEKDVQDALRAGIKIIQYREKNQPVKEMLKEAKKIQNMCKNKAFFIINDRADISLAINSDGIHLGQDDIPCKIARKLLGTKKIIGVTANNAQEAIKAEEDGADYIGASPIFTTTTKKDAGKGAGLKLIKDIKSKVSIPVVAIGGINLKNVASVLEAGADSVSAISAVIKVGNTFTECKKFIQIIDRYITHL